MIVCPNCKHDNPEGATNCEACYTALPATKSCPSCGASVQFDATFCGQCGHNLKVESQPFNAPTVPPAGEPIAAAASVLPPTVLTNPDPTPAVASIPPIAEPTIEPPAPPEPVAAEVSPPTPAAEPAATTPTPTTPPAVTPPAPEPVAASEQPPVSTPVVATQLQTSPTQVLHLQTNTMLEIPAHLEVIAIGKPNDRTPPDLDISGFPHAEVVSRVHASIRREGNNYYIEDVGSANGTYINHNVLPKGNRHLLRAGDRIGLGKGDLVTLIFQPSA